jgi:hypothetical protein
MNRDQAKQLVRDTFTHRFQKDQFRRFIRELLNCYDEGKASAWNKQYIPDAFKKDIDRYERLGTYTTPGDDKLDVLIVHLTLKSKLERARTALRNFVAHHLKVRGPPFFLPGRQGRSCHTAQTRFLDLLQDTEHRSRRSRRSRKPSASRRSLRSSSPSTRPFR